MGHEWISHIEARGAQLVPIYVDSTGNHRDGSLDEAMAKMQRASWKAIRGARINLRNLERVAPTPYLEALNLRHVSATGHAVYRFVIDDVTVFAPAIVLLHALVGGRLHGFGRHLLARNGLANCAVPLVHKRQLSVRMHASTRIEKKVQEAAAFQNYMRWIVSHQTARKMWDSVSVYAARGELALDFPAAEIICNIGGSRIGSQIFARRIQVHSLFPLEPPLPFAADLVKIWPVLFRPFHRGAERKVGYQRLADSKLKPGVLGFSLTVTEWSALSERYDFGRVRRPTVNKLLEKMGKALPWRHRGQSQRAAQMFHARLESTIGWGAFRDMVNQLRRA